MDEKKLQCLSRLWGHSREEDRDGIEVYRSEGFSFPLSRGRDWIHFHLDGTVEFFGSGPDDRGRRIVGAWTTRGPDTFEVRRQAGPGTERFTLVECDGNVLKLRRA